MGDYFLNRAGLFQVIFFILSLPACRGPAPKPVEAKIPPRAADSLPASQLMTDLSDLSQPEREKILFDELAKGNVPPSLRRLVKVRYYGYTQSGKRKKVTLWVMSDYLSVGSDEDFVRIPLTPKTAQKIADNFDMQLPTRKLVNLIYRNSKFKLSASPLPPDDEAVHAFSNIMRHNAAIQKQIRNPKKFRGRLVAGHKKDVVLSKELSQNPGRVAIYGWHKGFNHPIQPLSLVHDESYLDYSHGIRLLSKRVIIDSKSYSMDEILKSPELAPLLSDEGPLPDRYPSVL